MAWMAGSSPNRRRITDPNNTLASATIVIPWWWAMNARTIAKAASSGTRVGV